MKLAMALLTSSCFKRNLSSLSLSLSPAFCLPLPLSTSRSPSVSPYACELSVQVKRESLERKLKYNKAGDFRAVKTNVQSAVAAGVDDYYYYYYYYGSSES